MELSDISPFDEGYPSFRVTVHGAWESPLTRYYCYELFDDPGDSGEPYGEGAHLQPIAADCSSSHPPGYPRGGFIYRARRPPSLSKDCIASMADDDPTTYRRLRRWAKEQTVRRVSSEAGEEIYRLLSKAALPSLWLTDTSLPPDQQVCDGGVYYSLSLRRGPTVVAVSWSDQPIRWDIERVAGMAEKVICLATGDPKMHISLTTDRWSF